MSRLEKSVVVIVALLALAALADFALNRGQSRVSTTLSTVRDMAVDQYQRLSGQPAQAPAPAVDAPVPSSPRPQRAAASPVAAVADAAPAASRETAPDAGPVVVPVAAPADASPGPAPATRRSLYLPGRSATWASFDITFAAPLVIRAGGRVESGADASGPDGLTGSEVERDLQRRPGTSQRVLPTAPYLAFIARVCSSTTCTEPFALGSNAVLCPSAVNLEGTLQVWTNNYVVVDGTPTSLSYSKVSGGYSFYVEPAAEDLCGAGATRTAGLASSRDAIALEVGQTLRNPEFVISSSQSAWKPFFVPLTTPLLLRASGSMQPTGGAESTGPHGIVVPDVPRWSYPGERNLVVDADHRLFDPAMPYQALIGRLCGTAGCTSPFLVGTERIICPTPGFSDRIELWINHIIRPAGLLARQTPVTFDAFDLQRRSGAYRFEFSRAPAGACVD